MQSTTFTFEFYLDWFNLPNELWSFEIFFDEQDYDVLFDMSNLGPDLGDRFEYFWTKMEEYGVHDFSTEGDQIFGFDTYEVELKNVPIVMKKWRDFFIGLGYECGPLVKK